MSAAGERLDVALAELEPSERLAARAEFLHTEIDALRADPDLDLAALRVTAAAIRARVYNDVSEEEVAARASWTATEDDRRNAALLDRALPTRPMTAPDPSYVTPDGLAGEAVAPPTLEELMEAPRPPSVEATEEEVSHGN